MPWYPPALLKGGHQSPRAFSKEWARVAASIGFAGLTLHALRHSHASQLIDAGIDIVTISRRLGRAKLDITLRVYAHMFADADTKAADAVDAGLRSILARQGGNWVANRYVQAGVPPEQPLDFLSADGWPSGRRHRS